MDGMPYIVAAHVLSSLQLVVCGDVPSAVGKSPCEIQI